MKFNFDAPSGGNTADIFHPEDERPKPKIVGSIDLSSFQKKVERKSEFNPEKYSREMANILATQSQEVNNSYGKLLDEDMKIEMSGFYAGENRKIIELENKFLDDDKKNVLKIESNFASKEGLSFEAWRKKKDQKNKAPEMAVTALLHKFIGKDFIVARASDYDDYKNGVDTVLIDKKTGAVICGFDEVLGSFGDNGGEIKEEKILKKMQSGGTALRYGATIEEGVLKKRSFDNLPTFYLSLSKEELMLLLEALVKNNPDGEDIEKKIFNKFISLIKKQIQKNQNLELDENLKNNLLSSEEMINRLN